MDVYTNIATQAMNRIFNLSPRSFQLNIIPHLLKMVAGTIAKQPMLMVQPTGAGKSTVPLKSCSC